MSKGWLQKCNNEYGARLIRDDAGIPWLLTGPTSLCYASVDLNKHFFIIPLFGIFVCSYNVIFSKSFILLQNFFLHEILSNSKQNVNPFRHLVTFNKKLVSRGNCSWEKHLFIKLNQIQKGFKQIWISYLHLTEICILLNSSHF